MFAAVNDGYVPITDIDVGCTPNFTTTNHNIIGGAKILDRHVASLLWHGARFTLPCFDAVELNGELGVTGIGGFGLGPGEQILDADMTIDIEYSFLYLNLKPLRRSQTFHVRALRGSDNSFHWEYLQQSN